MPAPARKMRVHLMILDNEAGPINSAPGGNNPAFPVQIGSTSRWRFACDGKKTMLQNTYDRGTDCPWLVACDACKATEEFKALDRPRPSLHGGEGDLVADGKEFHDEPASRPDEPSAPPVAPKKGNGPAKPVGVDVKEGGCC